MKKILLLMTMCLFVVVAMAQKPQKTNFTYEVRNASTGALAPAGTTVSVDLKVYEGITLKGTDTHASLTTNALGQVTVKLKENLTIWTMGTTYVLKAVVTTSGYVIQDSDVPLTIGTQRDSTSVANRYGTMIRLSRVATTGSYTDLTNRPDSALRAEINSQNADLLAKIKADSTTLATRIHSDSVTLTNKMRVDSTTLATRIHSDSVTLTTKMRADSTTLATRIHSDSVTLTTKMRVDSTNLHKAIKDTAAAIRSAMTTADADLQQQINNLTNTTDGTINGLRDTVKDIMRHTTKAALRDSVKGQIKDSLHRHKVYVNLNGATLDTFRLDQADSIPVDVNLKEMTQRFTIGATTQTEFTLTYKPLKNFSIKLYINGVFICDVLEGTDAALELDTTDNTGKKLKYLKAKNGNYVLEEDDRVQISYTYIAE